MAISIFSLLVSLLAFVASFQHNRRSLRPFLNARSHTTDLDSSKVRFQASLVNAGNGPAIIRTYVVLHKGRRHCVSDYSECKQLFDSHFFDCELLPWHFSVPYPGLALRSGEEYLIADLTITPNERSDPTVLIELQRRLTEIRIEVEYEDCYGDIQPLFVSPDLNTKFSEKSV